MAGYSFVTGVRAVGQWARLGLHLALLLVGVTCLQVAAERTNRRVDLTATRDLSLAAVSEQVLRELDAPLHVTVFHRRTRRGEHAPLLERMRATSPFVEYELLDMDRYPERARALGVTQYGAAALEYRGRRAVVPALPEAELMGGILRVLRGRERRVLFTTGHGERAPAGDGESYGRLVAALVRDNHRIEPTSLVAGDVPDATDLVVVAGPRPDLLGRRPARLRARPASVSVAYNDLFAHVSRRARIFPSRVTGRLHGVPVGEHRNLALAVNGRVRATSRSFDFGRGEPEYYSFMVPEIALRPGANRLQVLELRD